MTVHMQRDLTHLRKSILELGSLIEEALANAVQALLERNGCLAETVIEGDSAIDRAEIEVEEECLKILALYQPVAHDLRFIVGVLKMNNDLERMGDHAVNIAKRARFLARRAPVEWPPAIGDMARNVATMLKNSLDALVNGDGALGREVCVTDDVVDRQKRQIADMLRGRLVEHPEEQESLLKMLDVPRHLERIADLATNIAEDVIYMAEGSIVRHHHAEEG